MVDRQTLWASKIDVDRSVIKNWRNAGDLDAGFAIPADHVVITEASYNTMQFGEGVRFEGTQQRRWHLDGSNLPVLQTDARDTAAFSLTRINLEVGDAEPTLTITHTDNTFDEDVAVRFGNVPVELSFTAGVATIAVDTSEPGSYELKTGNELIFSNRCSVTIKSPKIRRPLSG